MESVEGEPGDLTATLVRRPRFIDQLKCTGCGECAAHCPVYAVNVYNQGLDDRKAVYIDYAQAVPLAYTIDPEVCIGCGLCEKMCLAKAIDYSDKEKRTTLEVGTVILAPGSQGFDPSRLESLGYGRYPNVVTAEEFERILSASGPYFGRLMRPLDRNEPAKIAWLQCVGSRDLQACDHAYCSSVCCMYAIKEAVIAKEHAVSELDCAVFYMDMRTVGKDFEKYYNRAQEEGVRFIRSRIHSVDPAEDGNLKLRYVTEDGSPTEENFDLVVLSVGLETPPEVIELAGRLGVEVNENNFAQSDAFTPVATSRPGVFACGAFAGPKDIPGSVMEASAAACAATEGLASARGSLIRTKEVPAQVDLTGEPPRVGVFVCHCGINIAGVVDVEAVADYVAGLPYVAYVERNLFTCSQDTQEKMAEVIKEQGINRVVVAACTPRTHEPLFQETMTDTGLNKYLFEMANIRNQDSWVHSGQPDLATDKAKDLIRMAVAKAALLEPLTETRVSVNQRTLIIGGGVTGMMAALSLARQGYPVDLVEKTSVLGGVALRLYKTAQGDLVAPFVADLAAQVEAEERITIHLNSTIAQVEGFVGNFKTTIAGDQGEEVIEHGATLVCTGAEELKPDEYAYGQDERILTTLELDEKLKTDDPALNQAESAVFIQCVGSRTTERPWCSKVCCTHSVASALELKKRRPKMNVFILYRDMRTYGQRELLYKEAREAGVIFIRYSLENKPEVAIEEGRIRLKVVDHILGRPIIIPTDLLILASAIIPRRDEALAQAYKVTLDSDGWFLEAHQKLRPVEFATDGVFLAGLCHYPKPLVEAIAQAQAAVSRALTVLVKGTIDVGGQVSVIDPNKCIACGVCIEVCPYSAIEFNDQNKAEVNEVLCKGCGLCAASCRSGAPQLSGFTDAEIFAQIGNV